MRTKAKREKKKVPLRMHAMHATRRSRNQDGARTFLSAATLDWSEALKFSISAQMPCCCGQECPCAEKSAPRARILTARRVLECGGWRGTGLTPLWTDAPATSTKPNLKAVCAPNELLETPSRPVGEVRSPGFSRQVAQTATRIEMFNARFVVARAAG